MAENCKDNGADECIETAVGKMSLFDEMKEEKAITMQEQEEDGCQLHDDQKCTLKEMESNKNTEVEDLSHDEEEKKEILELRRRLDSLRRRRRRIQQTTQIECSNQHSRLVEKLNKSLRDRDQIVDKYLNVLKERDSVERYLECAKRWNVLDDCFPIWIDGKCGFATINGCRLGAEAPPLPTEMLIAARGQPINESAGRWGASGTNNVTKNGNRLDANSPPRRRILGLFGGNDYANNSGSIPEKELSIPTVLEPTRVPWLEINAALGHACLLLKRIQESFTKNGGNGMRFTHELHPMGATSKIGIRFYSPMSGTGVLAAAAGLGNILSNGNSNKNENDAAAGFGPPVIYNLFFEEASGFSFFKNNTRNFNWALQAFLQCIAEAAAQQADKTIAIPHAIQHKKSTSTANKNNNGHIDNSVNHLNGGEWTIGGLSICYVSHLQNGEGGGDSTNAGSTNKSSTNSAALEWTRACRYLLTDLKWLVANAAKHVDR